MQITHYLHAFLNADGNLIWNDNNLFAFQPINYRIRFRPLKLPDSKIHTRWMCVNKFLTIYILFQSDRIYGKWEPLNWSKTVFSWIHCGVHLFKPGMKLKWILFSCLWFLHENCLFSVEQSNKIDGHVLESLNFRAQLDEVFYVNSLGHMPNSNISKFHQKTSFEIDYKKSLLLWTS